MAGYEIRVDDHGLLRRLDQLPAGIQREAHRTVEAITTDAEGNVVRLTPVGATGHLRQSVTHRVTTSGLAIQGRVFSGDVPVKVASVETGRRPGRMPPRAPIELWVRRKLGLSGRQAERVAFLVARAIGRRGTKGAHMFEKGYAATQPQAARRVASLARSIGRLI